MEHLSVGFELNRKPLRNARIVLEFRARNERITFSKLRKILKKRKKMTIYLDE